MPKLSPHAIIWSGERQDYELQVYGQSEQWFRPGDEVAFSRWLAEHTAFAFVGKSGRLSILKEARPRGAGYWYAYSTHSTHAPRARKRYLGTTASVTLARLEEVAREIAAPSPLRGETEREEAGPQVLRQEKQRRMVLSTKLSPPRLPLSLVERERLLRELDLVRTHPLTLISASAGSGKTTLLSEWMAVCSQSDTYQGVTPVFAWLSLDTLDNDPHRFWASVIAALRTCLPTIGEAVLALLHTPQSPPLLTLLATLLNELLMEDRELILVLDDFHVIEDEEIQESLAFFLDHLPPTLHLVLATRIDPELPLSRLRVRGQLLEIRDRDLRFTRAETASFLTRSMGLLLSEEDVATLERRTEGWIAGLQLAALSLRKHEDRSSFVKDFAGNHRFVLDYVQQDILMRLSGTFQDFLLQTAILTRLHAASCQALTLLPTQERSQEMLEALERANLFVVPLDDQRQWYRYHDLFREALCARLRASQPDRIPLLHLRAARWYEAAGELREAITHALAAPDYPYAAMLMEQAALPLWLSGEGRTIQNWVLALPDTVLSAHTRLALNAALRLINTINLSNETQYASLQAQMEHTYTRMEGILRRKHTLALSEAEATVIERRLRLLRALVEARVLLKRGDKERLHILSQEIEALPQDEEVNWSIIPLTLIFWLQVYLQGEGATLIPRLRSMKQSLIASEDHLVTIRVRTMLVHAFTQATQWHQVQQECLETLALIEQSGMCTIWSGYLSYNLLILSYAWNRLEEASDWLQQLQRSAQDWQQVELLVRQGIWCARLALVRGDLKIAYQALHQLEALVEQEGYAYHASWVMALRIRIWLAEGKLARASEWVGQRTFSPETWNPMCKEEFLMLVQFLLAQQKYSQASEMLSHFREHLDRSGDSRTTSEFLVLQVVALHFTGKREEALRVAARLFALTEPEESIRMYLDAGEPMKQILRTWLKATPQRKDEMRPLENAAFRSSVSRLLVAFEQEESSAARRTPDVTAPFISWQEIQEAPSPTDVWRQEIEPLSQQEQRVLRLLVAGHTYTEMAESLIVSPNTVKTQVSSIYRKLGVRRRAEAIMLAGRLHLL